MPWGSHTWLTCPCSQQARPPEAQHGPFGPPINPQECLARLPTCTGSWHQSPVCCAPTAPLQCLLPGQAGWKGEGDRGDGHAQLSACGLGLSSSAPATFHLLLPQEPSAHPAGQRHALAKLRRCLLGGSSPSAEWGSLRPPAAAASPLRGMFRALQRLPTQPRQGARGTCRQRRKQKHQSFLGGPLFSTSDKEENPRPGFLLLLACKTAPF